MPVWLRYAWAAPATLLGLLLTPLAWAGGSAHLVGGVLEVQGGLLRRLLARLPITGGAGAMTLGHVVIGQDQCCLDESRAHERVHVRQYERWGPFLIPAYLLASLWAWLWGRDPYYGNPFEREAYRHDDHSQ